MDTNIEQQVLSARGGKITFFSTKAEGQGIGLTLIIDVMVKHGFQFNMAKGETGETEFTIVV